ncbi:Transposase [Phytophthora megakarya]|uniref:Transposase n=1 Tax=Phytophthora megakarya TaxID=4795 RepID=A0A225WK22_9STRA|nr:Transposase [Phytophthora megakarya]
MLARCSSYTSRHVEFGEGEGEARAEHDNASIHSSKVAKMFLDEHLEKVMSWPALSPDVNPIENIWGYLAGNVYEGGRQYQTKEDLISAIKAQWENMPVSYLEKLVLSMKKRCVEVLKSDGKTIAY